MTKWDKTKAYLERKVEGFEVKEKEQSKLQQLIAKITFWAPYAQMWTTLFPVVWKPSASHDGFGILQHEGVHLLDAQSLFGLSKLPRGINVFLFSLVYASPQIFAILSILAFCNPWWLLCLLFLAPLPSPGRAWAELRAYRRSVECSAEPERAAEQFAECFRNSTYYFMLPLSKKTLVKLLSKPSPYKQEMDELA